MGERVPQTFHGKEINGRKYEFTPKIANIKANVTVDLLLIHQHTKI